MPNEFQRVMDSLLKDIPFTNCYIDDIVIASKGLLNEHKAILTNILNILDNKNMAVKWEKCAFFRKKIEWLGFKISNSGVKPLVGKSDSIKNLPNPKNISELRSFFWSINQYMKFVPNLSSLSSPLRPLLVMKSVYQWNDEHTKAFEELKQQIVNITENNHFDIKRMSRLKTDASHSGLGATLEQWDGENWVTIAFATQFLNNHESKYSTKELELLAVVWATEHFKNYLYGAEFEIVTDHKAFLSALNANQGNKTMHSRLTRWDRFNRLLPFNFKIKHIPGKEMGFTDLLSRLLSGKALLTSHYDSKFVAATVQKIVENLSVNSDCKKNNCKKNNCKKNEVYNPLDVNTISNLDCNNPMGGKKELSLSIQRSFFSNILNYVNDTIRICNSNHSRSESCTSGCVPLNLSKVDFNYFHLSDKTFLFFLAQSVLLIIQSLNSDKKNSYKNLLHRSTC